MDSFSVDSVEALRHDDCVVIERRTEIVMSTTFIFEYAMEPIDGAICATCQREVTYPVTLCDGIEWGVDRKTGEPKARPINPTVHGSGCARKELGLGSRRKGERGADREILEREEAARRDLVGAVVKALPEALRKKPLTKSYVYKPTPGSAGRHMTRRSSVTGLLWQMCGHCSAPLVLAYIERLHAAWAAGTALSLPQGWSEAMTPLDAKEAR